MTQEHFRQIFERVKELVLRPRETWEKIRDEEQTENDLIHFLAVLAAVPAFASFLGMWLIGYWISFRPIFRLSFGRSLSYAALGYVLTVGGIWLVGKLIGYLSPRFGLETDEIKGMKLAVFSCSPYFAAGILNLFPTLSAVIFVAGLFSLYLLYLGLPIVMGLPKEKSVSFTTTILIIMACAYLIIGWMSSLILTPAMVTF